MFETNHILFYMYNVRAKYIQFIRKHFILFVVCMYNFILIIKDLDVFSVEMFYLTIHSTHFIYGYMVSDIT